MIQHFSHCLWPSHTSLWFPTVAQFALLTLAGNDIPPLYIRMFDDKTEFLNINHVDLQSQIMTYCFLVMFAVFAHTTSIYTYTYVKPFLSRKYISPLTIHAFLVFFKNVLSLNLTHVICHISHFFHVSYMNIVSRLNLSHSDDVSNIKSDTFTCFVFFILKLSLNDMCKFPDV